MRAYVLLNSHAGASAKKSPQDHMIERVRHALQRARIEGEVHAVAPDQVTQSAGAAARDAAVDAVIAAGGDGTVSAVASALAASGKPLGVLPMGTMNHFARNLRMPLALNEAADALAGATVHRIDLGQVNDLTFVNNASIGLYPRIVGKREALRRRLRQNKWLAMLLACVSVFRRFPTVRVRIAADGHAVYRDTPFVFVGNNRYEMNLLSPGERPRLDRGELGLYFANRSGRLAMLRLLGRALLGRLEQSRDFEAVTLPQFWVETGKPRVHVAVDGEVRALESPLHFRSRPGELTILAPAGFGSTAAG